MRAEFWLLCAVLAFAVAYRTLDYDGLIGYLRFQGASRLRWWIDRCHDHADRRLIMPFDLHPAEIPFRRCQE